jgi:hypothetical protein
MQPDYSQFSTFIEWGFYVILSGSCVVLVQTIRAMNKSIVNLNLNMARLIQQISHHENEIERMDVRLTNIETAK